MRPMISKRIAIVSCIVGLILATSVPLLAACGGAACFSLWSWEIEFEDFYHYTCGCDIVDEDSYCSCTVNYNRDGELKLCAAWGSCTYAL